MTAIDIAMPCYNCARWLDACVNSILSQQPQVDFRIIARDDASTDDTPQRLAQWQDRLKGQMQILPGGHNLGMVGNYEALLQSVAAQWVMLTDPDDVWLPGKMATSLEAIRASERENSQDCPTAIFSDAEVVDSNLQPIAPSLWKWFRQDPSLSQNPSRLLVDNPAISSTLIVNRPLLDLALPMSGAAVHPDRFLALTACCFGKLSFVRSRTMRYRRHSGNDSLEPITSSVRKAISRIGEARSRAAHFVGLYAREARGFLEHYRERLPPERAAMFRAAANLPYASFLMRRWNVIRYNLWFASALKNAGLMVFL